MSVTGGARVSCGRTVGPLSGRPFLYAPAAVVSRRRSADGFSCYRAQPTQGGHTMRYLILTAVLILTGCVTSPVVPLDDGNYMVSIHARYGLISPRTLLMKAADEADDYCALTGKTAHIISTGVPGFTNLSGNVFFTCIAPETPGDWQ